MPVCVPDTSCLIHLERIDRLDLLHALYDDLRIPPAVRDEYGGVPEGIALTDSPSRPLVRLLHRTVDAGEAEVIARGTSRPCAPSRRSSREGILDVGGPVPPCPPPGRGAVTSQRCFDSRRSAEISARRHEATERS